MRLLPLVLFVAAAPEWKQVKESAGITVEARPVEGSPFAELRAKTTVALGADALCSAAFGTGRADPKEPSLKSRRVISETADERVAYDQISPPFVSDRDYAVRTRREKSGTGSCRVTVEPSRQSLMIVWVNLILERARAQGPAK